MAILIAGCATRADHGGPSRELKAQPAAEASRPPAAESLPHPSPGAPLSSHEPAPGRPERLGWVNPARCLTTCTYDPSPTLVRIDDQGVADEAGAYRVDKSISAPLRELIADARAAGHVVHVSSAFRSYQDQVRLFRDIKQMGRAARPGHSEHQLGTAVDVRLPTSAAIAWLAEHAAAYGFALSYPEGRQRLTGYRPEPWHLRFVGPELAGVLREKGWTLEELFRARPELGDSGTCQDCPSSSSRARCGAVTEAGRCKGTVLSWCYDGALATVDCSASNQRCGQRTDAGEYDCIAP